MRTSTAILALVCGLAVSACQVTSDNKESLRTAGSGAHASSVLGHSTSIGTITGYDKTTNQRISTAAKQAVADGNANEALVFYERLYLKDSSNLEHGLNYAQVLRKTANPQRAVMVLAPFIEKMETETKKSKKKAKKNHDPLMVLEYASAILETGKFERAETYFAQLLTDPEATHIYPQVRNLIGVSLDARGYHKKAEAYYRDAMSTWEGQPISVMNNLALNLAHQGYFDEALNLLRQARVIAPGRQMIATNIDLITSLQSAVVAKPKSLN